MKLRVLAACALAVVSATACHGREAAPRSGPAVPVALPGDAAEVTRLADAYVSEFIARFPEQAEGKGLAVPHDGLSDNSLTALEEWRAREDELAKRAEAIDAGALKGRPEWVTLGFLREALASSRGARVCRRELWPVDHYLGWLRDFSELAASQPVGSDQARRDALARFGRVPRYLDTEVANLKEGVKAGFTTPRGSVDIVITQLDALLAKPVSGWPLFSPAARDGDAAFGRAWSELLEAQIAPAVARYRDYLREEYRARARQDVAITALPGGRACYRALYRLNTSLDRSPEEVMEIGQRAVARNMDAALALGKARLGTADMPSLVEALHRGPHFTSRDDKLAFARAAMNRARDTLPRAFLAVPATEVRLEPYPEEIAASMLDSYRGPTDGRPYGVYRINLVNFAQETRAGSEKVAFHETFPGHALQHAFASAQRDVHPIAKLVRITAFLEGWARYAEGLADELGLYSSDEARLERLLWPARGMVVDPGLLVFGWTRERAISYVVEGGWTSKAAENFVDRIPVRAAQLTSYDSGGLEITALREQAQHELGPRFDLRKFHQVVLEHGAVTLPMLRELVEDWIRRES